MGDLIIVGGGMRLGLSRMVESLMEKFDTIAVGYCCVEDYLKSMDNSEEDKIFDFNEFGLNLIERENLIEDVEMLLGGFSVHTPVYNFGNIKREGFRIAGPCDILILEGMFAFNFPEITKHAKLKVFVDSYETIIRNIPEFWQIIDQDVNSVERLYSEYLLPYEDTADIVLEDSSVMEKNVEKILQEYDRRVLMSEEKNEDSIYYTNSSLSS